MRYSTQLSDAVHILAYIAVFSESDAVTSDILAASIETNPTNVRKIMGKLRQHGLIHTVNGRPKPTLSRPVEDITLYDVFISVNEDARLIEVDDHTNPRCIIGANIQQALEKEYDRLQQAAENEMKQVTLADILRSISTSAVNTDPKNAEIVASFL
ncbi:Rrf2 family transcriptional regulator [Bifidobacterium crudilactis]|uniref:Rrf2 family transcriptional regulator n=1 Tax=Bifidobacterium crudilactis TaxID=327277 RepID=UPI0005536697|nr:Rrf2 family transcriptional regulator [Bifidobacterium crudilactis]